MKKAYLILALVVILVFVGGFFLFGWIKSFFDASYDLPSFSKIYSNIPYDIEVRTGPKERIEITGDNKYGDKIETQIVASELKLTHNTKLSVARTGPQIIIYKKNIESITLANKGSARVDVMTGNNIDLESKDKGNLVVDNLTAKTLIVTVRNSGDITATGKADTIDANVVNSAGKINLTGVEAPIATKKDVGTGTIKFNPSTVVEGDKPKNKSK